MRLKRLICSDNAVVGVVVAILLVGLVVAVMSMIQTVYVPSMMEEREAEHMEVVAEQFARLKSAIDTQISGQKTPIASSVTLGSKELPFFMSLRAFGAIEIIPDNFELIVENIPDPGNESSHSFIMNTIRFSSANGYFVDHTYSYESGAVIISQSYGDMLYILPAFEADLESRNSSNVLINLTLVNISGVGGKTYAAGYGTYPIQTEFSGVDTFDFDNINSLVVMTDYVNSWNVFFENSMFRHKLVLSQDYSMDEIDGGIRINFMDPSKIDLTVSMVKIDTQIGPGWIEQ